MTEEVRFYTQYVAGRLASVHYAGAGCSTFTGTATGNNYIELYAYSQAGQVTRKTMRLWKQSGPSNPVTISADLEAVYTYDGEGKMLTQSYPLWVTYQYTYDSLGRPTKMTDTNSGQDLVAAVTYGPAGELLSMTGASVGETRTYNSMGQLLTLTGLNGVNLKYNYAAAGLNNGQIASQQDLVSGETVNYQYDSLKRLSAASSTQGWNQNFGYDGFGNLTGKTGSGVAPVGSYPADPATNRLVGISYDANGNQLWESANSNSLVYDVSNRMTSSSGQSLAGFYEYDASNKRVYQAKQSFNGTTWVTNAQEYYFYGINGKKIGTYFATVSGSGSGASISWSLQSTQLFFRGKLIQRSFGAVQEDVRGSVGSYYPYGEDRTATANDVVKFASYVRDSVSGLDYASNRYYISSNGRFASPDPYVASGGPSDPGSWNKYVYVQGDPVQFNDPRGLFLHVPTDPEPEDPRPDPDPSPQPGRPVPPQMPNSAFPKCNPSGAKFVEQQLSFVAANYEAALDEARAIAPANVSVEAVADILIEWSAQESDNGASKLDVAENNYFGWQNKGQTASADGTIIPCTPGGVIPANTQNACFASDVSWGEQLEYVLSQPSGKTLIPYVDAFVKALSGGSTPTQALQAIASNGYNTNPNYGAISAKKIPQGLIDCLRKSGYL